MYFNVKSVAHLTTTTTTTTRTVSSFFSSSSSYLKVLPKTFYCFSMKRNGKGRKGREGGRNRERWEEEDILIWLGGEEGENKDLNRSERGSWGEKEEMEGKEKEKERERGEGWEQLDFFSSLFCKENLISFSELNLKVFWRHKEIIISLLNAGFSTKKMS